MSEADISEADMCEADTAPWRILFVCTGNLCRSPVAERLMRAALVAAEVPAQPGAGFEVTSAGTRTYDGRPMEPNAARVLAELGGPTDPPFASRRLTREIVRNSDLILTAAREHRLAVCELEPPAWQRTFTLAEFSRLLTTSPAPPMDGGTLPASLAGALVRHAAASRRLTTPARPADDDIEDPIGARYPVFRRGGTRIADHVGTVARHLTGAPAAGAADRTPGGMPPAARPERRWLRRG